VKRRLYLIGNTFRQNSAFKAYIIRSIEAFGALHSVEYFDEATRDFYSELESRVLQNESIYIVTNAKSFTLVGKLLSSLTSDNLVIKNGELIPSKCEHFKTNSYLLHLQNSALNVIQALESDPLAEILLTQTTSTKKLHFFTDAIKTCIDSLKPLSQQYNVTLTYSQVVVGWIEVLVTPTQFGSVEGFLHKAMQQHPQQIIITEDIVKHIVETLIDTNQKISLAESCTGGLLAYYFTSQAGVSAVFDGSLVTYSNILKENWIAVEHETLVANGAVSEATVQEMCSGVLNVSNADYALAISGIAGPDGGTAEKPVGTVVIGVASTEHQSVVTHHFKGDRKYIQEQSALTALKMLILGHKKVFFTN